MKVINYWRGRTKKKMQEEIIKLDLSNSLDYKIILKIFIIL